ncbi:MULTISPECIES: hypothetical protein [Flavobacterium]|uniref:DUF2157 domain-containing protein n=1 Tax=Flavobacterium jumunjinense TaxID=998845 RepID=A0ABV5GJN2_9FLAO|nr:MULTISPECIES: hypothetical protein [Flavobacterium]
MISYDKKLLENTYLVNEAKSLETSGFISQEQVAAIKNNFTALKTQDNLFIRICLFLLGSILYLSICGAIGFLGLNSFNSDSDTSMSILIFIFGLTGFLTTEFILVRTKNYFGNGLDDSFIIGMQIAFNGLILFFNNSDMVFCFSIFSISTLCYFRYLHLVSLLASYISVIALLFFIFIDYIHYGAEILPFILFFFGIGSYLFSKKITSKIKTPYYSAGILLISNLGLILTYLSMNYFIVRELSNEINSSRGEIPMAWLFYSFTILIPLFYLFYSIKTKNKPMLWIGGLTMAFTVFTIRYYHHIMPTEISLTLAGIILFSIAFLAIRKLKMKESGITFLPDRFEPSNSLLNIETLASASQFGIQTEDQTTDSPMDFGGGGFSGGGAGESF